eukprot:88943_1
MPLFSRFPVVRSWSEFCNTSKFSRPNELSARIATNITYYSGNYLIIFLIFSCFTCIVRPLLLVIIFIIFGVGAMLKSYFKNKSSLKNQKRIITQYYIYISLLCLIIFGNGPLLSCLSITLLIIVNHALFRQRSIKSKVVMFMDKYNDFGPISSLIDWIHHEKVENDSDEETQLIDIDRDKKINIQLEDNIVEKEIELNDDDGLFETSKLISISYKSEKSKENNDSKSHK